MAAGLHAEDFTSSRWRTHRVPLPVARGTASRMPIALSLADRRIWLTGAAGGLGASIVATLLECGAGGDVYFSMTSHWRKLPEVSPWC